MPNNWLLCTRIQEVGNLSPILASAGKTVYKVETQQDVPPLPAHSQTLILRNVTKKEHPIHLTFAGGVYALIAT